MWGGWRANPACCLWGGAGGLFHRRKCDESPRFLHRGGRLLIAKRRSCCKPGTFGSLNAALFPQRPVVIEPIEMEEGSWVGCLRCRRHGAEISEPQQEGRALPAELPCLEQARFPTSASGCLFTARTCCVMPGDLGGSVPTQELAAGAVRALPSLGQHRVKAATETSQGLLVAVLALAFHRVRNEYVGVRLKG